MESNGSDRRRFLKHAAALAGVSAGAGAGGERAARGQQAKAEQQPKRPTTTANSRAAAPG